MVAIINIASARNAYNNQNKVGRAIFTLS